MLLKSLISRKTSNISRPLGRPLQHPSLPSPHTCYICSLASTRPILSMPKGKITTCKNTLTQPKIWYYNNMPSISEVGPKKIQKLQKIMVYRVYLNQQINIQKNFFPWNTSIFPNFLHIRDFGVFYLQKRVGPIGPAPQRRELKFNL